MSEDVRRRCYISCPITNGDRIDNYTKSLRAERFLMSTSWCAPLNPGRSIVLPHAWDGQFSWQDWLDTDLSWVRVSESILRLPGKSPGADEEVALAEELGIPVFTNMRDLCRHFDPAGNEEKGRKR